MDLTIGILGSLIASLILIFAGFLARRTLWRYLLSWYYTLVNKEVQLTLLHVVNYASSWKYGLNESIFQDIRKQSSDLDNLTRESWNETALTLHSEKLSCAIVVCLDEELEVSTSLIAEPEVIGYKVYVETPNPIRIGLRRLSHIQYFSLLSERIHEVIRKRCLSGEQSVRNFLICNITLPKELSRLDSSQSDPISQSKATFSKGTLTIICLEPKYVSAATKAFVRV